MGGSKEMGGSTTLSEVISRKTIRVQKEGRQIHWTELQKHNKKDDCWIAIRGKVYDVTKFLPYHPGGVDFLLLSSGRDSTQNFECYHPVRVFSKLENYYVGEYVPNREIATFPPMSEFYKTLKSKVENYFLEKKFSPRQSKLMVGRIIAYVLFSFVFHFASAFFSSTWLKVVFAAIAGEAMALICFQGIHEASHASLTSSQTTWRTLGSLMDFVLGASYYSWLHQHFLGHHPYTNVSDVSNQALDPDIVTGDPDVRRIKPSQKYFSYYKLQLIYAPLLYGLLTFKFRINDISIWFINKSNGQITLAPPTTYNKIIFWSGKLFFVLYRIVLPCYFFGWKTTLLINIIEELVCSYSLAISFQLNHVAPQAIWPTVNQTTGQVNMDWAEMQIRSTIDYAHGNKWTSFWVGGLNYQVPHHLFPNICQVYYPEIVPMIKEHCKEYNIPYTILPSFWDALVNHLKYLWIMGSVDLSDI